MYLHIIPGSGESHMAYFYRRHGAVTSAAAARPMSTRASMSGAAGKGGKLASESGGSGIRVPVTLDARNDGEQEEQILCDPCFVESIRNAICPVADLKTAVYLICSQPAMVMRSKSKSISR